MVHLAIMSDQIIQQLKQNIASFRIKPKLENQGVVLSAKDGIIQIYGLEDVVIDQLVLIEGSIKALVVQLDKHFVSAIVLTTEDVVQEGAVVQSTGQYLQIGASHEILGRTINFMGEALDGRPDYNIDCMQNLQNDAPQILDRAPIAEPCMTGVKMIDAFIPIGLGQREMIIGDRVTGKTSLAIDLILNQKDNPNVVCIYAAIGQRSAKIAALRQTLENHGAMDRTVIVASTASDTAIAQVQTAFAACAIGEYFRDRGKHAIVIYDDLSKHAVAYRHISLLLRRPPGREAYPGDIFYLHARLLERAAKLNAKLGSGSLTAIPIVETQEGNFATYIATNVWSITDGQIVLKSDLWLSGQRPAIDIGMSVSRVGSVAQLDMIKPASKLKLKLASYNELKNFATYGAELDKRSLNLVAQGDAIVLALQQKNHTPVSANQQALLYKACMEDRLNHLTLGQIKIFEQELAKYEYKDSEYAIEEALCVARNYKN